MPLSMAKDKKRIELLKGNRRNHKEINRCNPLHMIAKEGLPGLQWPILPRHHVDRNRGLGHIDAQFEQFPMDLGSAPQRVLKTHSSDQVAQLFADPRPAPERARPPSPISGKTHSMPTYNRLGSDDGYGIKNARAATIEPDEQSAVDPTQVRPAWRALPEHIELMPQDQDLGFQPPSRLEAVAQRTDEEEGNCNHQP